MNKNEIVMYMHGGSGNHGCEAIINSTCNMLSYSVTLVSANAEEDRRYSLDKLCRIHQERSVTSRKLTHVFYYGLKKIFRDKEAYVRYRFKNVMLKKAYSLYVSVGGDNYCYEEMLEDLIQTNKMLTKRGKKTVLWGCSIEPSLLERPEVVEDLKRYSMIIARESITYEALKAAEIGKQLYLYPDPAFSLESQKVKTENVIGINVSPMVVRNEKVSGITLQNYTKLMEYILLNTDMKIRLIPHVIWKNDDDRKVLDRLYSQFKDDERVSIISDDNCEALKGIIGECRMFIGARTHATIAAYSNCVPTLVVGYSVKARGIARDLFGTDEGYVIPVQMLTTAEQLIQGFQWLTKNENAMRDRLQGIMPEYIAKAREAGKALEAVIDME